MGHVNHRVVTFTCTGCRDKDRECIMVTVMYRVIGTVTVIYSVGKEMFLLVIAGPKGKSRIVCLIVSL